MVTIGMNYRVRQGKEDVFERAFARVLEAMKENPGHSRSRLYRDVHDGPSYLILSEWNDKAAFESFIRSDAFARVANWGREEILEGRPTHHYYGE